MEIDRSGTFTGRVSNERWHDGSECIIQPANEDTEKSLQRLKKWHTDMKRIMIERQTWNGVSVQHTQTMLVDEKD